MQKNEVNNEILKVYQELKSRYLLATQLGLSFSCKRDLYQVLGYEKNLTYENYFYKYRRQDIANAVVNKIINTTWRGGFEVFEGEETKYTALENKFKELYNAKGLKRVLVKADKLAMIFGYSCIFIGANDVFNLEDLKKPLEKANEVLYFKAFNPFNIKVESYETNTKAERYGLPLFYRVTLTNYENQTFDALVHHSRIIHVVYDDVFNEIEGASIYESIYNRLEDLEKLVGGSAEMFWRGARPGYSGKIADDFIITDETIKKLQEEIEEYEHDLRRLLLLKGVDLEALQTQIANPAEHVNIQLQLIAAATGIPYRILLGSERGELASTQDREEFLENIYTRRTEYVEPTIIRPLVDKLIKINVLPEPQTGQYSIKWEDLFSINEENKAKIGQIRTQALAQYANALGASAVVPPEAFLEIFLGLSKEQRDLILSYFESENKNNEIEE